MKTLRRITVEIEKRTVEWNVSLSDPSPSVAGEPSAGACPRCGSAWVLLNQLGSAGREYASPGLEALLVSLNLHIRATPSDRLWICQNSFEQLKEKL